MVIVLIFLVFISITFHEYAHGWVADKLGDPTPRESGRLTLNPLAHIDLFGTIILPIVLSFIPGVVPFGYAKPVPINPNHFKNPKNDVMWVGLAGPTINILIAFLLSLILKFTTIVFISDAFTWIIIINIVLAVFNLIPIPPLDGSRIIAAFLPSRLYYDYLKLQIYGFILIIVLVNLGLFRWFILPVVKIVLSFLGIGGVL